jgi:hypothetical protein
MTRNYTNFCIASDLFEIGRNECNEPYITEVFYVVGETDDGYRIQHRTRFPKAVAIRSNDEYCECGWYPEYDQNAEAKAQRLCDRVSEAVARGVALTHEFWETVDPAYGSEAYQREGTELERAFNDRFDA